MTTVSNATVPKNQKVLLMVGLLVTAALFIASGEQSGLLSGFWRRLASAGFATRQRAEILDRNGVVLARSTMAVSFFADPSKIIDPRAAATSISAILPNQDASELAARLAEHKRFVWVARQVPEAQSEALLELHIDGLGWRMEAARQYPEGRLFAHVVGFTDVDNRGLTGIEAGQNASLDQSTNPIRLTVDTRVQEVLRTALLAAMSDLRAVGAAGVVMDARTGGILALVSLPDFDPSDRNDRGRLEAFNRAALGIYQLGSLYLDVFLPALAVEEGRQNEAPLRLLFTITRQVQQDFLRRLGVFRRTRLEIPENGTPLLAGEGLATGDPEQDVAITTVQMTAALSTIVNGGIFHEPTLLWSNENPASGTPVFSRLDAAAMRRQLPEKLVSGIASKGGMAHGKIVSATGWTAEDTPRYVVYAMLDNVLGEDGGSDHMEDRKAAEQAVQQVLDHLPLPNADKP